MRVKTARADITGIHGREVAYRIRAGTVGATRRVGIIPLIRSRRMKRVDTAGLISAAVAVKGTVARFHSDGAAALWAGNIQKNILLVTYQALFVVKRDVRYQHPLQHSRTATGMAITDDSPALQLHGELFLNGLMPEFGPGVKLTAAQESIFSLRELVAQVPAE